MWKIVTVLALTGLAIVTGHIAETQVEELTAGRDLDGKPGILGGIMVVAQGVRCPTTPVTQEDLQIPSSSRSAGIGGPNIRLTEAKVCRMIG